MLAFYFLSRGPIYSNMEIVILKWAYEPQNLQALFSPPCINKYNHKNGNEINREQNEWVVYEMNGLGRKAQKLRSIKQINTFIFDYTYIHTSPYNLPENIKNFYSVTQNDTYEWKLSAFKSTQRYSIFVPKRCHTNMLIQKYLKASNKSQSAALHLSICSAENINGIYAACRRHIIAK